MRDIKEARKELKRVGCSKAEGDALRFMYANLIAFQWHLINSSCRIDWPVSEIYQELGKVADNKIQERANQILANRRGIKNGKLEL